MSRGRRVRCLASGSAVGRTRPPVGLDTEFVGVGRNTVTFGGSENALARISIVEAGSKAVLLDCFVKVPVEVMDFRIGITGITQNDVDGGISLSEVQAWVKHILHGRIVVGHNLSTDWKVLGFQPPEQDVRDTSSYKPLRPPTLKNKKPKLAQLAETWLGLNMQEGVHDSVEDAAAALDLYLLRQEEWEGVVAAPSVQTAAAPSAPAGAGSAPTDAMKQVAWNIAECQRLTEAQLEDASDAKNMQLAKTFQSLADKPSMNKFAKVHFQRVALTFRSLPFRVLGPSDLERPELRCIGKRGSKSWGVAVGILGGEKGEEESTTMLAQEKAPSRKRASPKKKAAEAALADPEAGKKTDCSEEKPPAKKRASSKTKKADVLMT